MTVSQRDARSVRVEHDGLAFSLAYRFWWDGRDREPESIAVDGGRVTAFFLSASIRDTVTAGPHGVLVRREWSVRSPGQVRLALDVRLEPDGPVACLLPGVALARDLAPGGIAAHANRTAWPCAAGVTIGGRGIVGFALEEGTFPGGIAFAPIDQRDVPPSQREEGATPPVLSLQVPGPAAAADPAAATPGSLTSDGTVEETRTFRLVAGPARRSWLRGASAVLATLAAAPPPRRPSRVVRESVAGAVARCLATHLYERGGVAGLRLEPQSPLLSASAGAGMAVLLRELFPGDPSRAELALRLADFSMKGQHPRGLFCETFHADRGEWQGVGGHPGSAAMGIAGSARTADRLLAFADSLAAAGLPHEAYRIAGERFVEQCFDEQGRFRIAGTAHRVGDREPGSTVLANLELCFPLARVLARMGHDRHRKAIDALAHDLASLPWGTPWLPSSTGRGEPDASGALLCGRVLLALDRLAGGPRAGASPGRSAKAGRRTSRLPVDPADVASVVLPWVYANPGAAAVGSLGGIVESFPGLRLAGAGAEAAWVLAGLAELVREPWVRRALEGFARHCLAFADGLAPGTAYVDHLASIAPVPGGEHRRPGRRSAAAAKPAATRGPVDARRLVSEATFRLAIAAGGDRARRLV